MVLFTDLTTELNQLADPVQQRVMHKFFKMGKGDYAEKDIFLGIKAPQLRRLAKKYQLLDEAAIEILLNHNIHEYRQLALFLLVNRYQKASPLQKQTLYQFYLNNLQGINNWDLVDNSAPHIVGDFLYDKPKHLLYELAQSDCLWHRRISIVATLHFIKKGEVSHTLSLAQQLLADAQPLIHKAVGWMLREVGKQDMSQLEHFLQTYAAQMPRVMLRYAIEKFDQQKRAFYLKLRN